MISDITPYITVKFAVFINEIFTKLDGWFCFFLGGGERWSWFVLFLNNCLLVIVLTRTAVEEKKNNHVINYIFCGQKLLCVPKD